MPTLLDEYYIREEPICALDPLLLIPRIEYLNSILRSLESKSQLYSLVILDMKNFHAINDMYSYAVGDSVLADFITLARSKLPPGSITLRYRHGDEFLFFVPLSSSEATDLFAEINAISESESFIAKPEQPKTIKVSFCHAVLPLCQSLLKDGAALTDTAEQLLRGVKKQPSARRT